MLSMKRVWILISAWSSKAWEAIKKLPGWAVVAFLIIGAFVVHIMKRNALIKKRAEAERRLSEINIEYMASIAEAEAGQNYRKDWLKKQREEGRAVLEQIDQEIDEAAKKGSVGIASEWKAYLSGGKK